MSLDHLDEITHQRRLTEPWRPEAIDQIVVKPPAFALGGEPPDQ
jgi:hypothetical protein